VINKSDCVVVPVRYIVPMGHDGEWSTRALARTTKKERRSDFMQRQQQQPPRMLHSFFPGALAVNTCYGPQGGSDTILVLTDLQQDFPAASNPRLLEKVCQ